jgi:hypothetical protein
LGLQPRQAQNKHLPRAGNVPQSVAIVRRESIEQMTDYPMDATTVTLLETAVPSDRDYETRAIEPVSPDVAHLTATSTTLTITKAKAINR